MEELFNWSEISRHITNDRGIIRSYDIPKKYIKDLDKLFSESFPNWWKDRRNKPQQRPRNKAKI
jgi:hypothetical protein